MRKRFLWLAAAVFALGAWELATPQTATAMYDCDIGEICGGPGGRHCVYTPEYTICVTGSFFICYWESCYN